MKKSLQGIVQRIRGRGTDGISEDRMRRRTRAATINSGMAANDETAQAWMVAA